MASIPELRRQRGSLQLARKLLTTAALLQLPFLIEIVLRQAGVLGSWQMPGKISAALWFATSLLAIVGFSMVCRQLDLWEGDLENADLAQRTRMLGSRKIAASIQLFFYLAFLMPLLNLVPVIWARSRASAAIGDLDLVLPARRL